MRRICMGRVTTDSGYFFCQQSTPTGATRPSVPEAILHVGQVSALVTKEDWRLGLRGSALGGAFIMSIMSSNPTVNGTLAFDHPDYFRLGGYHLSEKFSSCLFRCQTARLLRPPATTFCANSLDRCAHPPALITESRWTTNSARLIPRRRQIIPVRLE